MRLELDQVRRDGRNQLLKARAAMQSRQRELEDKILSITTENNDKVGISSCFANCFVVHERYPNASNNNNGAKYEFSQLTRFWYA